MAGYTYKKGAVSGFSRRVILLVLTGGVGFRARPTGCHGVIGAPLIAELSLLAADFTHSLADGADGGIDYPMMGTYR